MTQDIFSPWGRPPLPPNPVTLLSQDEMVARIEAIRAEEAPETCPTCGTASKPVGYKRCSRCGVTLPLGRFSLDYGYRVPGPRSWCRPCAADAKKQARSRRAIRALRSRAS